MTIKAVPNSQEPSQVIITHKVKGSEWVDASGEITLDGFRAMVERGSKNTEKPIGPVHYFDMGNGYTVMIEKERAGVYYITDFDERYESGRLVEGDIIAAAHLIGIARRPALLSSPPQQGNGPKTAG